MAGPVISLAPNCFPCQDARLRATYEVLRWAPVVERVKGWKPFGLFMKFDADLVTFAESREKAFEKLAMRNARMTGLPLDDAMFSEIAMRSVTVDDVLELPSDNLLFFLMGDE